MASSGDSAVTIKEKTPLVGEAPKKRPHLPALDSTRFFLISYIVVGHFVEMATKNELILRFFTQINVVVGAFFVISGYMAAYTTTELGKLEASPRLQPASAFVISRIMGYYHLHFFVSCLFLPLFVYADWTYNGAAVTAGHGFMSFGLLQAWFPMHAEIWNAPMWFLSALSFATIPMPFLIPPIAKLSKKGLRQLLITLTATLLLARVAYSYDLNVWSIMEGRTGPKAHPSQLAWNVIRFNPAYALMEIMMGVVAVRFVMLDGFGDEPMPAASGFAASPVPPLLGMLGVIVARTYDVLPLNDPLTRSLLFIPLFTLFIVNIHRQTIYGSGPHRLNVLLSASPLTYLGGISFPIFVVHGPLGQLFYKKLIKNKVFGSVFAEWGITTWPDWFFFVYLGCVLLSAVILQHGFVNQQFVKSINTSVTKYLQGLFK